MFSIDVFEYREMKDCDTKLMNYFKSKYYAEKKKDAESAFRIYKVQYCGKGAAPDGGCLRTKPELLYEFWDPFEANEEREGILMGVNIEFKAREPFIDFPEVKRPNSKETKVCMVKYPFIRQYYMELIEDF